MILYAHTKEKNMLEMLKEVFLLDGEKLSTKEQLKGLLVAGLTVFVLPVLCVFVLYCLVG